MNTTVTLLWMVMGLGCLTYDDFAERVVEKKCEEDRRCSPAGDDRPCDLYEVPGASQCLDNPTVYNPGAAGRCLRKEWVCNTDIPGFEFAEEPADCDVVCLEPVDVQ